MNCTNPRCQSWGCALHDEDPMSAETLLTRLDEEREKFADADDDVMNDLVQKLITMGEYPTKTKTHYTVRQMVDGWGAYWHRWTGTLHCPHCTFDLRDHQAGPPFMRTIGISNGDRVVAWACPHCNNQWPR